MQQEDKQHERMETRNERNQQAKDLIISLVDEHSSASAPGATTAKGSVSQQSW